MAAMGFFLICAQVLSSCMLFPAVIIPGVSPYEQNLAQTDLPELAHRKDAIDIAARIGESLGYKVSLKTDDAVILLHGTSAYREPITGEYQSIQIFVYKIKSAGHPGLLKPQDREFEKIFAKIAPLPIKDETVCLSVYSHGVYYAGRQENLDRIMGEFKNKLLAKASGPPTDRTP